MITISVVHDPAGRMLPILRKSQHQLKANFTKLIVAYTATTNQDLISLLDRLNFLTILSGGYSQSKREALKKALKLKEDYFFFCDFDKILHWLEVALDELKILLNKKLHQNYLILGRGKEVFKTYPKSWQQTEKIINNLLSKILGLRVDVLSASCIFDREAAKLIVKESVSLNWESAVEWPLIVHQAGLKLGYQEALGLTWEDPDRFKGRINKIGDMSLWKEIDYHSPWEWEKRLKISLEQIRVIQKFTKDD